MYTVKQIAKMAGVTVRTLHYYDEIDLFKPSAVGDNGYRYYTDEALLQLQQILLYREMDMDLICIKSIIQSEEFDLVTALQQHRQKLNNKINHLRTLVKTVDATLLHLVGEINMSKNSLFAGFSQEKQQEYEAKAVKQWGDSATQSLKLWHSYSEERKKAIIKEGHTIYTELAAKMSLGPGSPEIQALLQQWHKHLQNFYEPSFETLRGLGEMYQDHPDFRATFTAIHPDLPAFLQKAINHYVEEIETQWLEQELAHGQT